MARSFFPFSLGAFLTAPHCIYLALRLLLVTFLLLFPPLFFTPFLLFPLLLFSFFLFFPFLFFALFPLLRLKLILFLLFTLFLCEQFKLALSAAHLFNLLLICWGVFGHELCQSLLRFSN